MILIQEQILADIRGISDPLLLNQLYSYLQLVKKNIPKNRGNVKRVLQFAGIMNDKEAAEMTNLINKEFNHIEGDW